ncbi:MAG: efflux RND transporter permease subunit, partial [Pirellulaceae bacterium]|nr:efflux RND transporter permease subunit [Pirellulaceae bacterium]
MKSLIRWTITNTPAMNTLMIAILAVGLASLMAMRREVFPEFELDYITITVPYPGASPEEVEEGICQKIEEAVRSRDGIKKIMSTAREGVGIVVLELFSSVPDVQKVLNEIRSDVDRIPSLPELAEDAEIEQILIRRPAIRVGVIGPENESPDAEIRLRDIAEQIRDELLQLPSLSQVELVGVRDYQIDIEISEDTLRKYGLTLQQVARIVRRENIEMPGGNMKTDSQEILLRGKNKRLLGPEIAKIPLVTQPDGVVLTVGDLGVVRDEFVDTTAIHRINGKPGMVIAVQKTSSEDLLQIVDEVKQFLKEANKAGGYTLPPGYSLVTYDDNSIMVHDRINLLA